MWLGADRVRDAAVGIAVRAGRPVAAGEWHDSRPHGRHPVLERVRDRPDRRAVTDPDDGPVADARPQDLCAEAPDDPPIGVEVGTWTFAEAR